MNTTLLIKECTISRIQHVHESVANGSWFSRDNKDFFNSKWSNPAYEIEALQIGLFVSSEKFNDDDDRKYTIRLVDLQTGNFCYKDIAIPEIEFQKYFTSAKARRVILTTDWSQYESVFNQWRDEQ